jgi:hypothetical protein
LTYLFSGDGPTSGALRCKHLFLRVVVFMMLFFARVLGEGYHCLCFGLGAS